MGVLYMPFFDIADAGVTSITLSTAGESNIVINLATFTADDENSDPSSIFSHYNATSIKSFDEEQIDRFPHYARAGLMVALQTEIRAQMTSLGWPSPSFFLLALDTATGLVSMGYVQTFGVDWGANNYNAMIFGFAGGLGGSPTNLSGANSYTGTKAPHYVINCNLTDVSQETGVYEPEGLGNHVTNDTGGGNTLARTQAPLFNDWVQEFEPYVKTYTELGQALFSSTFTHQDLFRHCRKGFPFVLWGDDRWDQKAQVYSLRSDGMSFHPARATPGNGSQFHVPYRCHLEGTVT